MVLNHRTSGELIRVTTQRIAALPDGEFLADQHIGKGHIVACHHLRSCGAATDEPLAETARREVLEETGIDVARVGGMLRDWGVSNVYEIYPVWRHRYAPGVTHNTEHVFGLTVPSGTPVVLDPREHLHYQWLPWREAADRCFSPSNAEAILHLPRLAVTAR